MTTKWLKNVVLAFGVTAAMPLLFVAQPARAQWVTFDPTNYIQNFLTQLRAVESNINEAQQIANQISQLKNMAQNTGSLVGGEWTGMNDTLSRLDSVLSQGQSLALSSKSFDQQFRNYFPGYKDQQDYSKAYQDWNTTSMDSVRGALDAANLQYQGVQNEHDAIERLRTAAMSTSGQKAALDASNQIALQSVQQTQKLRELMMSQMQAQGTFMANQQQRDAAAAQSVDQALQYRETKTTGVRTDLNW